MWKAIVTLLVFLVCVYSVVADRIIQNELLSPQNYVTRGGGGGVRSEKFINNGWNTTNTTTRTVTTTDSGEFIPPVFCKTVEERKFLRDTLRITFMFQDIPKECFTAIIRAFEKIEYPRDSIVVEQGDTNADYMYVLAEGECSVIINGETLPDPYGTMKEGTIIGELALLYDSARAATITAKTNITTMFRLDRDSFMNLLSLKLEKREELKTELAIIDQAIDKIAGVTTKYGGTIVRQFKPTRLWLYTCWEGTIIHNAWQPIIANMISTAIFSLFIKSKIDRNVWSWSFGMKPDPHHPIIARLLIFGQAWKYMISVTTFVLTFFLSQAYAFWKSMYTRARIIQGRMNDIGFLLATSAKRDETNNNAYTVEAKKLLDDVATFSRLYHAFLWSNYSKDFNVLRTGRGISRMLSRGLLTPNQFIILQDLDSNVGIHNACLEWLYIRILQGIHDTNVIDESLRISLLELLQSNICQLRGTGGGIGDSLDGRIPLAYVHFVQVLVDTFLLTAPVGLYAELGAWSIPTVGLLTLFYSGLLDLAKVLLDPLDKDDYFYKGSVNMDIGVLIRESNTASTRWQLGAENLPF